MHLQALCREGDNSYLQGCWSLRLTAMTCWGDTNLPPSNLQGYIFHPVWAPPSNHQLRDANTRDLEKADPRTSLGPSGDTVESQLS